MNLPDDNRLYKTKDYWEQRYRSEKPDETFDWFKRYQDIKPHLDDIIPKKSVKILMLGCGNSTLSADMYNDGYHDILNVDFSETVIDKMKNMHPEMEWKVMDVQNMCDIRDESIDIAIDKGTMDALMCEKGDVWEPSKELIEDVRKEVDEVSRVLRKGGKFIYLTFGQPHFRRRHLTRPCWDTIEIRELGESFHYYLYAMAKGK